MPFLIDRCNLRSLEFTDSEKLPEVRELIHEIPVPNPDPLYPKECSWPLNLTMWVGGGGGRDGRCCSHDIFGNLGKQRSTGK